MMEWLANISVKWVLVAVGILLLLRLLLLKSHGTRELCAATCEFLESALVAIVFVFLLVRPFFIQAYFIPSGSMRPTLQESDRILVNKLVYRLSPPRRGDILVFRPPADRVPDEKDYIKRLIGLPGETVEVVPQRLMVDGKTLLRLTRREASDVRSESFRPDLSVGFTLPIGSGSVIMAEDTATITGGLEGSVKVATFRPGDAIRHGETTVFRNGELLLNAAYGPVEVTYDLTQWGGENGLEGMVFSITGTPRLILVRGERMELDEGHVLINGKRLPESYLAESPNYAMPPFRLPAAHYFMMGDNRNESQDSHAWGPLPADRVIGRAEVLFWPPGRFRWIHGR